MASSPFNFVPHQNRNHSTTQIPISFLFPTPFFFLNISTHQIRLRTTRFRFLHWRCGDATVLILSDSHMTWVSERNLTYPYRKIGA
ncbi:hypothetical protein RJT34_03234 [Clitoria ternatea]|uniref:Uncharacterized protein n=1 Tax=Clitoria ternatea TaxID=43366 RepID=A0AAN9Q118_CLITE